MVWTEQKILFIAYLSLFGAVKKIEYPIFVPKIQVDGVEVWRFVLLSGHSWCRKRKTKSPKRWRHRLYSPANLWDIFVNVRMGFYYAYHSQMRMLLSSDVVTSRLLLSTNVMVFTAPKCLKKISVTIVKYIKNNKNKVKGRWLKYWIFSRIEHDLKTKQNEVKGRCKYRFFLELSMILKGLYKNYGKKT